MKGGAGERRNGCSVTALTVKAWPVSAAATAVASAFVQDPDVALLVSDAVVVEVLPVASCRCRRAR